VQHILVLGDQLNLARFDAFDPKQTNVLMIESMAQSQAIKCHKQRLLMILSAMRHFRLALKARGFTVIYGQFPSFEAGLAAYFIQFPNASIEVMQPADYGMAQILTMAVSSLGGRLKIVENTLWLSTKADWDKYAKGKKSFRMEFFYRELRRKTTWLMQGDEPLGGHWNFDTDNRQVPPKNHVFPVKLEFVPDAITLETKAYVEQQFPDHFGTLEHFNWAVTREDALQGLHHFLKFRLYNFGAFEDAMVDGETQLYHGLLSPAMNIGLISAKEVCEAALDYLGQVPLPSLEGFIRQILGWREFMHHVYDTLMPDFREANQYDLTRALPAYYWTSNTKMRCVKKAVQQVWDSGHAHHIQRLMVLGNFALLAGVKPQAVNNWFLEGFVDAFDWVVTPNVIGMSQYADAGSFTSKPYISGAGYINRMSNHCQFCAYKPKETIGSSACPFNSLYWNFIDQHLSSLVSNPRMSIIVANWKKRQQTDKQAILEQATRVLENLEHL
jgi:deoxyribodipyrimidine photolyase-related protein